MGIRYRRRMVLLRDDHIGDSLGAIFLDPSAEKGDEIISRLRDYLGEGVRVIHAEVSSERIEVEVEVRALAEEANRLAAAANDLSRKGVKRNAIALNRQALHGLGLLLADLKRHAEALAMLKLARESGPETADLLHALARVCMQAERTASAICYLEKGFELDPSHFGVRRALAELGRRPRPPHRTHHNSSTAPLKPVVKQT